MATFTVSGPLPVRTARSRSRRVITAAEVSAFWDEHRHLANRCGCYLFAMRFGESYRPIYAGRTAGTFKTETFQKNHKLAKYVAALRQRGKPVLFFISLDRARGRVNEKAIDEVETFLIQTAYLANMNLLNDRKTRGPTWVIRGVRNAGRGKRAVAARELRQCIKLD